MGWTADGPVTAQHEVKALREMVGSSYNGRLARSSSSMSNHGRQRARAHHCPTRWPRSYRLARLAAKYVQPVRRDAPGQ